MPWPATMKPDMALQLLERTTRGSYLHANKIAHFKLSSCYKMEETPSLLSGHDESVLDVMWMDESKFVFALCNLIR